MKTRILMHGVLATLATAGCAGEVRGGADGPGTEDDLAGIAGPPDPSALRPVARIPRALFGARNDAEHLTYPEATPSERRFLDPDDPDSPLHFFITIHTREEGVGPMFNQPRCLGCHMNSDDIERNQSEALGRLWSPPADLNFENTPASRAGRQGVTDYSEISRSQPPPTASFTLFGDYNVITGTFDPLTQFGGPIQHVRAVPPCEIDTIPPESIDPNFAGGADPVTGISDLGFVRAVGERAAPPYIGRGLMEAVYAGDILANEDPEDLEGSTSSLPPSPDSRFCASDCISGRHNENRADLAFVGGDSEVRLARFGLRAAGPTLLQFDVGGTQGEIGLTSPFLPTEQPLNQENQGRGCDTVPDPELTAETVEDLRTLLRLLGIPDVASELLEPTPSTPLAADIQAGARLFGVDLEAFRSRMVPGMTPTNFGDPDADRGIAADRQLNCVGCHIPIMRTGRSPARVGGELLSNRWAPLFSDLLIHDMGKFPFVRPEALRPAPYPGISRNLADFALPDQGRAMGNEWRTPPLMGIGKTGAPFLHDARVFLNVLRPAETVASHAGAVNERLVITNLEEALLAAIELHDLPAPPANAHGEPDDSLCPRPTLGIAEYDICRRSSPNRSEAGNVMERWRRLSREEQLQVVKFLEAL
ncbi:di-heme oxidoredictase family protein [Sorangium sp. So ce118]